MDGSNRVTALVPHGVRSLVAGLRQRPRLLRAALWLLLVGLLATVVWLRFFDLRADPPHGLSQSAGFFFDGFANSHAARSYVKFGTLRPDEWDPYIYSPIHVALQVPWFMLFGSDVTATNSFGSIVSLVAVLLLVLLWSFHDRGTAWVALLFVGCSYPLVQFGRLCLFENVMVVCMVLSLLFFHWPRRRCFRFFLAGAFAFLAYATKAIGLYFVLAASMAVAFHCLQPGRGAWRSLARWRPGLLFGAGLGVVLLLWLFLFRLPNSEAIAHFGAKWVSLNLPRSLNEALVGAGKTPAFFAFGVADKVWIIAVCAVAWVLHDVVRKPASLSSSTLAVALWLVGGTVAMSILRTGPARYFYPMMYPVMYLAAYGVCRVYRMESLSWPRRPGWADLAAIGALTIIVRFYVTYQVSVDALLPPSWPRVWSKLAVSAALSGAAWTLLRLAMWKCGGRTWRIAPAWRMVFLCVVLVYFTRNQVAFTRGWLAGREYSLHGTSHHLQTVGPMVVGGTIACAVVPQNDSRAVRIGKPGWCNYERPFERFGVNHLFISPYAGEEERYFELYPDAMARSRAVQKFNVCGYPFTLYEILPLGDTPSGSSGEPPPVESPDPPASE